MITVITGAPGAGKTSGLVTLLAELGKGRAIYVNGIPGLKIQHLELEHPEKWMDEVPNGSIIAVDEGQRIWRPMGPGQRVPDHIAAMETHRHRGIDFYIITQSPKLIHSNIRGLCGRHVHLRDLGILGRWWYEWPEISDNCANAWKNAPIKKRHRLQKSSFSLYKSASEHIKPVRSFPWMLVVAIVALFGTIGLVALSFQKVKTQVEASKKPIVIAGASGVAGTPGGTAAAGAGFIDDRIAWVPRVSHKPESAPAYDGVRQVVAMPVVAAAVCNVTECRCYTQQGTPAGLTSEECRTWLENPPFNAYQVPEPPKAAAPTVTVASGQSQHAAQ